MRPSSQHHYPAHDGASLFYRAWLPSGPPQRALLLFHRGHEHSARLQTLVDGLGLEEYAVFAWDQRGCGHSPGARGHARNLAQLEQDMQAFLDHICTEHAIQAENIVVIAHSMAAVVAGLWAVDYAPRLRGLVLATPALHIKLYVPLARPGLALARRMGLMENVHSYIRGGALTHDREQAREYDQDPLISRQISTDLLLDLHRGAQRLQQCAANLDTPTLVLSSRADWVVKNRPIRRLFRALPSPYKESQVYRNFYHDLFHEKDRHLVFQDVRGFVLRCFDRPVDRSMLVQADRYGLSAERYRWHQAGLPWLHPKNWVMKKLRLALRTVGRISQGMRLGLRTGFSSGSSLDYVYQNQPRGFTPLGRWLDANYLQAIGWVRVRQRRAHLMQLLSDLLRDGITVLDVAGGPARYLIDLLAERPDLKVRVRVCDRDEAALEQGRQMARADFRLDFAQSDALDPRALAAQGPVDVAIVSGLYELLPNNAPLVNSLQGLAAAVPSGGYLIYTNQPYHPQLELIAETLTHGDGSRWVMRCRSTAEMDELVSQAGFRKLKMLIDDDGIFSVSLAQRL
jgi:alpha-beta hydrolase superfamily lysophospholipase/SAM-dependent methyltransferase